MPTFLTSCQLLTHSDSLCQDWLEGHQNHHFLEIKNAIVCIVHVKRLEKNKSVQCF